MYHYATRNSAYVIDKIDFLVYFFTDMIQVCFSVLKTIISLIYFIIHNYTQLNKLINRMCKRVYDAKAEGGINDKDWKCTSTQLT